MHELHFVECVEIYIHLLCGPTTVDGVNKMHLGPGFDEDAPNLTAAAVFKHDRALLAGGGGGTGTDLQAEVPLLAPQLDSLHHIVLHRGEVSTAKYLHEFKTLLKCAYLTSRDASGRNLAKENTQPNK